MEQERNTEKTGGGADHIDQPPILHSEVATDQSSSSNGQVINEINNDSIMNPLLEEEQVNANENPQADLIVDDENEENLPARFIIRRSGAEGDADVSSSDDDEMNGFFSMARRNVEMDVDSDSSDSVPDQDFLDYFALSNQSNNENKGTGSITNVTKEEPIFGSDLTVQLPLTVLPPTEVSVINMEQKLSNRPSYLHYCEVCKKPADFVCKGCYRAAYCSEKHQRERWNEHRRDCVNYGLVRYPALLYRGPITIDRIEKAGKIPSYRLKSNIAVPANEIFLEERPFLICPWPRLKIRQSERHCPLGLFIRNMSCFGCGKTLCFSWTRCDDCNLFLCSKKCLYITNHKKAECKIIQRLVSQNLSKLDPRLDLKTLHLNEEYREFLYMDIMILRLVLKFSEMRETMSPEDFADAWSKLELIWNSRPLPTGRGNERHNKIIDNLQIYFRFSYALLEGRQTLLWKLFSIIDMNSFPFELPFRRFRTLCVVLGLAGHSCIPNSHVSLYEPEMEKIDIDQIEGDPDDLTIVVRSGRGLSKGTTITFSYVPLIFGTLERRSMLLATYFLWCMCSRCVDPTECNTFTTNIKCPTCQNSMLIPSKSAATADVESELRQPIGSTSNKNDWECRGNVVTKRSAFCRPSIYCAPLRHDDAMVRMRTVEIAISKYSVEQISRIKDLLIAVKTDNQSQTYFYQSAILKISEDVIRGTFFPLPDVLAEDLSEFNDQTLTTIVLAKNLYQNFMKKVNPGFNFEGFPIANLQFAENELLGRETGKMMYLEAVSASTSKSRIRGLIRPNLSIII